MTSIDWSEFHRRTTAPFAIDKTGKSDFRGKETGAICRPVGVGSIEYVLSGGGTVTENDKTFRVKAGDTFILHAKSYHYYYPDPDDPWVKLWVQVSGPVAAEILKAYGLSDINVIPELDISSDMLKIHNIINDTADGDTIDREGPRLLLELVQKIHSELRKRSGETPPPTLAERIKEHIDSIPDGNVSLEAIADGFHLSKQHVIRVFKEAYGTTPHEYILHRRISIAKALLRQTELTVEEISDRLGFCDPAYFTLFFRKKTSLTPLKYRREKRERK